MAFVQNHIQQGIMDLTTCMRLTQAGAVVVNWAVITAMLQSDWRSQKAPAPRQTIDEAGTNRIGDEREYDRNSAGYLEQRLLVVPTVPAGLLRARRNRPRCRRAGEKGDEIPSLQ
jgi:hypothetical protein